MRRFRKFWGRWPDWFGMVDGGSIVYVRIRNGDVWIGEGNTEESASATAVYVSGSERYEGVTDAVDALFELRKNGYYFVPNKEEE